VEQKDAELARTLYEKHQAKDSSNGGCDRTGVVVQSNDLRANHQPAPANRANQPVQPASCVVADQRLNSGNIRRTMPNEIPSWKVIILTLYVQA
jgi:hypothetical protein